MRITAILLLVMLIEGNVVQAETDIQVCTNGWGEAQLVDIHALLKSTMSQFTPYFGTVVWPAVYVFHNEVTPITIDTRREDGRVQIGLNTHDRVWSQYAFQFGHEFVHLIVRHLNAETERRVSATKTGWLEESLCEAGSLFALRRMSRDWETNPPYSNWVEYRNELQKYAQDRFDAAENSLPHGKSFDEWFRSHEADFHTNPCNREANTIVAKQMLPVFEKHPAAWNALGYLLASDVGPSTPTRDLLIDWRRACPGDLRPYVDELAEVLGFDLDKGR